MDCFSGDGERWKYEPGVLLVGGDGNGLGSGEDCRVCRQEAYICLHRCADMVYVGDMATMAMMMLLQVCRGIGVRGL